MTALPSAPKLFAKQLKNLNNWGYGDKQVQAALALPTQVTSDQKSGVVRFPIFPLVIDTLCLFASP